MTLTVGERLALKATLLARGVRVTEAARKVLTASDSRALLVHDYATTTGIALKLPGRLCATARPVEAGADAVLETAESGLHLRWRGLEIPVEPSPPPAYAFDACAVTDGVMTHGDRIRVSPIDGCSYHCRFCDSPLDGYGFRDVGQIIAGVEIALAQPDRPRHMLISGGTPCADDQSRLDAMYRTLLKWAPIPTEVMLAPRPGDDIIERLHEWGADGVSINLELFDRNLSDKYCPQKAHLGLDAYTEALGAAVRRFGRQGRVRSLLLAGLEPPESTLEGVRFVARLGADPVISPFQPAAKTDMESFPAPDPEILVELHHEADRIARDHGVRLGPRCLPCQHNTLTLPEDAID